MNCQTHLEKEVVKSIKEEQVIQDRVKAKTEKLQELKKKYSQATDELYSSNQVLIRMKTALRQQSKDITKQTKNYIDNCVGIALCDAESQFYSELHSGFARNLEYEKEMAEVVESRDKLVLKLAEYRSCRENFITTRHEVSGECNRARQECLDAAFYCQDIRSKLTHDLKKAQHSRQDKRSSSGTRVHVKNLSDAISIIAERVLDSREELRGYFSNQMQKLKREQRLVQEAEDLHRQRKRDLDDINGTSTKKDIENFIRSQKLFDEKDDSDSPTGASSPDGKNVSPEEHGKFSPKPPMASNLAVNLSPRAGNLIKASAKSQRDARAVQWASVNVDSLGRDLVLMCQLQGKRHRLQAMKTLLQTNNLYHIALLQCISDELRADVDRARQAQEEEKQRCSSSNQQSDGGPKPLTAAMTVGVTSSSAPSTGSISSNRGRESRVRCSSDENAAAPGVPKRRRRVVKAGSNLTVGVDNSTFASQYTGNGMTYAQSMVCESIGVEKALERQRKRNAESLMQQCSHDLSTGPVSPQESSSVLSSQGSRKPFTATNAPADDGPQDQHIVADNEEENEEEEDLFDAALPQSASLPPVPTKRPTHKSRRTVLDSKKRGSPESDRSLGLGMQLGTVVELNNRKARDKEREKALDTAPTNIDTDEVRDDIGLSQWINKDKYKSLLVDILVSELNASGDTPVELGMAKITSMGQIAAFETTGTANAEKKDEIFETPPTHGSGGQSRAAKPAVASSRATYASQHRNVQIRGLAALNI